MIGERLDGLALVSLRINESPFALYNQVKPYLYIQSGLFVPHQRGLCLSELNKTLND